MNWMAGILIAVVLGGCATIPAESNETSLRAVDEAQRRMVTEIDQAGLAALAHPNLRINAPTNRILDRDELLTMIRTGEIASERFARVAEQVSISGRIGVVMGREMFTPTATSELGRRYGAVPLQRRYTNVYVREGDRWRWLARHANIVPER